MDAWKRLRTFVDAGGLLVVFPPADATVHLWPEALDTAMGTRLALARSASEATDDRARLTASASIPSPDADLLAPVRTELDELVRPVTIFKILPPLGPEHGAAVKLLSTPDGTALVWAARPGDADTASASRGQIIVVTSALDLKWTDLPAKPLMVPLMQELLRQGVGRARPALWTIAGNTVRVSAQSVELKRVGAPSTEAAIRIGERSETVEPVRTSGLWNALDSRNAVRAVVAVNADDSAARTDGQDRAALAVWLTSALADSGAQVSWLSDRAAASPSSASAILAGPESRGTPTSSFWLFVAVGLAVFEVLLARFASHRPATAVRSSSLPGSAANA